MNTVTYLPETEIRTARVREHSGRDGRNALGYGSKIVTGYELLLSDKRWRRVYCVCWSNAGSLYVMVGGKPHYLGNIDPRDFVRGDR